MQKFLTVLLRCCVAVAVSVGLFTQIRFFPAIVDDTVDFHSQYAPYAAPYAALGVLIVACVQVALIATWVLLGMVSKDVLFTHRAVRWVDSIILSGTVATLVTGGAAVHLAVGDIPYRGGAMQEVGMVIMALGTACAGAAFVMLVAVMRGLLRKAADLADEMARVV